MDKTLRERRHGARFTMKVLNYFVVGLLTAIASLGMVVALRPEHSGSSVKYVALSGLLLGWAILLGYYQSKSYRGGAASIIGAVLVGVGIWTGLGALLWEEQLARKDAGLEASVIIFLIGSGIALMLQGHRIHKLRKKT
jgi:hypothetical protein